MAEDISGFKVMSATLEVERVQPSREGWEGCHARERTRVDSGKSWKVANKAIWGRGSVASLYKLIVPVDEAIAKVSGWKGEKWRSRIAEGWVTIWTRVLQMF